MNNLEQFLQKAKQCETDLQAGKLLKAFEHLIEPFDLMIEQKTSLMSQGVLYFKYVLTTRNKTRAEFTLDRGKLTANCIKQDGTRNTVHFEPPNMADLEAILT